MKLAKLSSSVKTLDLRSVKPAEGWAANQTARTLTGRPWRRLREQILRRDGYLCQCEACKQAGRLLEATEVDHIIPLSQGGTDDRSNLRAINAACHRAKTARESRAGR